MITPRFWNGRRVFVTGHTGFKGSWLALWLSMMGARVAGFALPPPTCPALWSMIARGADIDGTIADVRDLAALEGAMRRFDPEIVFHLAAQSLVRPAYDDPVGTYATNVMGTVHLLDVVRRSPNVRAAVIVTSDKCYENREQGTAYREDAPFGGHDPYSNSKGCAELVTAAYRASYFSPAGAVGVASARAGNVIGGGDWATDRLVPDVIRAAMTSTSVRIRNPNAVRPWQHVLEPLCGYLRLAEALCERPGEYAEGWNFGPSDSDAVPVESLVKSLVGLWGSGASWTLDRGPHPHEARFLNLDSSKASNRLHWKPRLGLAKALEWTVEWYKSQAEGVDIDGLTRSQIARYMELGRS